MSGHDQHEGYEREKLDRLVCILCARTFEAGEARGTTGLGMHYHVRCKPVTCGLHGVEYYVGIGCSDCRRATDGSGEVNAGTDQIERESRLISTMQETGGRFERKPVKTILASDRMGGVLFDVQQERKRQGQLLKEGKFPWGCDDPKVSDIKKLGVLAEEFGEAAKEVSQIQEQYDREWPDESIEVIASSIQRAVKRKRKLLREELIQIAAVAVAWCESLDAIEESGREE
jgi:hypothetical protein